MLNVSPVFGDDLEMLHSENRAEERFLAELEYQPKKALKSFLICDGPSPVLVSPPRPGVLGWYFLRRRLYKKSTDAIVGGEFEN